MIFLNGQCSKCYGDLQADCFIAVVQQKTSQVEQSVGLYVCCAYESSNLLN